VKESSSPSSEDEQDLVHYEKMRKLNHTSQAKIGNSFIFSESI
jgi:hypothetical protein